MFGASKESLKFQIHKTCTVDFKTFLSTVHTSFMKVVRYGSKIRHAKKGKLAAQLENLQVTLVRM